MYILAKRWSIKMCTRIIQRNGPALQYLYLQQVGAHLIILKLLCKHLINCKNQFHDFVSKHVVEQLPPDQSAEHGFESKQAKEALVAVERSKNDQHEIKESK